MKIWKKNQWIHSIDNHIKKKTTKLWPKYADIFLTIAMQNRISDTCKSTDGLALKQSLIHFMK